MQSFLSGQRAALLVPALAVSFALLAPLTADAQSDTGGDDNASVARISVIDGNVGIQRDDSADSVAAALNAPVLGGDYLTTGDGSRSEVQFDGYARVRVSDGTQLRFTQIDAGNRSVQLAAGTIDLRLLDGTDGSNEIDTPSVSIKPESAGSYRVSVSSDGQTFVTVRSGRAAIDTPQGSRDLEPGATLVAQGSADNPTIQTIAAAGPDDFDAFNTQRDRIYERSVAQATYVNTDIGGVDDLEGYGHWVTDGSYGHVWVPASTGPNWAPYRDGRWVWEDGYGWTWVADEPWGWAPYHYGSWYHSEQYGWCWDPPQPRVFTPWRPALVAFIGFGSGVGLSIGFGGGPGYGNIGWVPLAPSEPYHPWWGNRYGGGPTVINNVTNITNVTNVTNINVYKNVRYNAVSSVTSQRFLQGNFSRNTAVSATQLRDARAFRGALPVVPTAANLRFTRSAEQPRVALRPALMQRAFAGHTAVAQRTPFAAQRVAYANVTHAPITPLHFKDARTTPLVPQPRPAAFAPAPTRLNPASNVRVTEPAKPAAAAFDRSVRGAAASAGWARFNQTRGIAPQAHVPAARPAYSAPAGPQTHRASAGPVAHPAPAYHAPTATQTYRAPTATQTYRAPAQTHIYRTPAVVPTYKAPAYHTPATPQTYRAPVQTYRAPVRTQTYHSAPVTPAYHAPAYHAPPAAPAYHAPPAPVHVAPPAHAAPPAPAREKPAPPQDKPDHHR